MVPPNRWICRCAAWLPWEPTPNDSAQLLLLQGPDLLTRDNVQFAMVGYDEQAQPVVLLELTPAGTQRLAEGTWPAAELLARAIGDR